MKRHTELVELSREHQAALQLAVNAKRAAQANDNEQLNQIAQQYIASFATVYQPHFVEEEQRILPKLREAGELALVERVEQDHAALRALAAKPLPWTVDEVLALGELMMAHVRFEERELFPRFEQLFLT